MSFKYIVLTFIVSLICFKFVYCKQDRLYVYQKDISEHCRRRAAPSVFLGRHVVASNSKILHFSQKNLPYSCSITIRAESGSNIIMMVQLLSVDDLMTSCSNSNGQMVVNQMGETFGGYWGPIPHVLIKQPKHQDKIYTHKISSTAPSTAPTRQKTKMTTRSYSEIRKDKYGMKPQVSNKYIKIDVPLVNLTFDLVPGVQITQDSNRRFEDMYDVTPIPGVKYDTTLIPIAEINVGTVTNKPSRTKAFKGKEIARLMPFTPDVRLEVPDFLNTVTRRKPHINDFKYNKLLKLKPRRPGYRRSKSRKRPSTEHYRKMFDAKKTSKAHTSDPKNFLDKVLELIEENNNDNQFDEYKNLTMFLQNLTDTKFNYSAYLYPKIVSTTTGTTQWPLSETVNHLSTSDTTTKQNTESTTSLHVSEERVYHEDLYLKDSSTSLPQINRKTLLRTTTIKEYVNETDFYLDLNYTETDNKTTTGKSRRTTNLQHETQNTTTKQATIIIPSTETLVHKVRTTTLSTNLVDHESWENVVQVAPVMAILLNQTIPIDNPSSNVMAVSDAMENSTYTEEENKRMKRFIEMVPIENARPRQMTTTKYNTTVYDTAKIKVPDMQDFAQLVEVQDDEDQGRVALRYIRNYIGPMIYNICDFNAHAKSPRSVYLFNTSRIVITLQNFSMERMTLILTPGRTVLGSNSVCPENHLECQVTGARVCIDSINACDGLPNCGVYDIYDEDRVRCGRTLGLQHNVALAAFAFVSVLLTALYGVHYWLKRCVPAVSDAFFVYINGADNILYLETIMRAPTDMNDPDAGDDMSKQVFHNNLLHNFDEELFKSEPEAIDDEQNTISLFTKLMNLFRKKQYDDHSKKRSISMEIMQSELDLNLKPFSFAEYELSSRMMSKDIADASVQTGTSLELRQFDREKLRDLSARQKRDLLLIPETSKDTTKVDKLQDDQGKRKVDRTINAMRLFRQSRQQIVDSTSTDTQEEEMHSTSYDTKSNVRNLMQSSVESHHKKHLRFDEATTLIGSDQQPGMSGETSSFVSSGKIKALSDDEVADDVEKDNKKDFRRFWKVKKVTKKKQQQLQLK